MCKYLQTSSLPIHAVHWHYLCCLHLILGSCFQPAWLNFELRSLPVGFLQNRCYMWRMMPSPLQSCLHLPFRILERLKEFEIKYRNDYFRSFLFGCINKSRNSLKHLTVLTARSRRCLALSLMTGFLVTASAWTDGTTFMPISSSFSLGMIGFLVTSLTKLKRQTWSFSVNYLEQTDEFSVSSHLALFCFTKSIRIRRFY